MSIRNTLPPNTTPKAKGAPLLLSHYTLVSVLFDSLSAPILSSKYTKQHYDPPTEITAQGTKTHDPRRSSCACKAREATH